MQTPALTTERQEEADRIFEILRRDSEQDLRDLARLLASKPDGQLLGATEFALRDRVLAIAARALEAALAGRKKGGTKAPASPAPTARGAPSSSAGRPRHS